MKKPTIRTVRCVIRSADRFLLAAHLTRRHIEARRGRGRMPRRWGLVGGRVEAGEAPELTLRRELREELYIEVGELVCVGDYRYKGHTHRVFGTDHDEPVVRFDRREILSIHWHTLPEVEQRAGDGSLHTGFELAAIRDFLAGPRGGRGNGRLC